MVSLSVSSVKNNMLAAYLDNKIFSTAPSSPHKKIHSRGHSRPLAVDFIWELTGSSASVKIRLVL